MDMLVDTVRDEIAECSEKAYPSIGAKELQSLLMMTSNTQLAEFADGRGWSIDNGPCELANQLGVALGLAPRASGLAPRTSRLAPLSPNLFRPLISFLYPPAAL